MILLVYQDVQGPKIWILPELWSKYVCIDSQLTNREIRLLDNVWQNALDWLYLHYVMAFFH